MISAPLLRLADAALLIVDAQRDFIHADGALTTWSGLSDQTRSELGGSLQRLAQTMHAAGRPVIYATTELRTDYADSALPPRWQTAAKASGGLIDGSWGAALIDALSPEGRDFRVVKKGLSAFQHTNLDRLLVALGVDQLIVAGGSVTGAISGTVRLGAAHGYMQFVVSDAVYPPRADDLQTLRNRVSFVTTSEVEQAPKDPARHGSPDPEYALIVVDIQNDFVHADGAMHKYGTSAMTEVQRQEILAHNRALAEAMRERGWPVIYVRDVQSRHGHDTVLGPMMRRAIPMPPEANFIKEGTWGAEFIDGLGIDERDIQIVKRGNSGFGFTPLHRTLRNLHVRRCLVTGGAVVGCLSDTVREGVGLGYEITIVADAVYPPADPYLDVLADQGGLRLTQDVLTELKTRVASPAG